MSDSYIIYIEPDEEITSVIDRIKSSPNEEVVLVIPRGSVVAQSLLNLKLLVKTAKNLNRNLSIVTQEVVSRQLAARIGLTVYESVEAKEAQQPSLTEFHKKYVENQGSNDDQSPVMIKHFQQKKFDDTMSHARPDAQRREKEETIAPPIAKSLAAQGIRRAFRLYTLKSFIALVLLIGLYVLLVPKAKVTIIVSGEPIEREHSITIDPSSSVVSSDGLLMPGELVEVTTETTQQFPATGKKDAGEKAHGKVTISNRTGEDVTLAAGTKLKTTAGLIYLTDAQTTVKAAVPKIDPSGQLSAVPGQATVEASAIEPGEKYNSTATSTLIIIDLSATKQDKISGEAVGFNGGSNREVTVVSSDDIESGKRSTRTALDQALKDESSQKTGGKTILDGAFVTEVTDEQVDQSVGAEAGQVSVKLKGKAKAIVFSQKIFQDALVALVRKNLTDNQDITLSANDQINTTVQSIDFEQKKLVVRGKLSTRVIPKINSDVLKKMIVGVSPRQATEKIRTSFQAKDASVAINPLWYPRLPFLGSRISIEFQHD